MDALILGMISISLEGYRGADFINLWDAVQRTFGHLLVIFLGLIWISTSASKFISFG